jgi:hypothetical protein
MPANPSQEEPICTFASCSQRASWYLIKDSKEIALCEHHARLVMSDHEKIVPAGERPSIHIKEIHDQAHATMGMRRQSP